MAIFEAIKDRCACPSKLGATTPHGGTSHYFYVPDKDVRDKIARIESGKDCKIESKAYQHIVLPDSELPNVKARMKAVYEVDGKLTTEPKILDKDGNIAAPVKASSDGYYDMEALKAAQLFDDSAQDEGCRHKIIDGTAYKSVLDSALKSRVVTKEINPISAIDKAAVTKKNYILGPSDSDYANALAFKNDTNNLTGDIEGRYNGLTAETGQVNWAIDLSSYRLRITGPRHYGNPNNGATVTYATNEPLYRFSGTNSPGAIFQIDNIYLLSSIAFTLDYAYYYVSSASAGFIFNVFNTMNSIPNGGTARGYVVRTNSANCTPFVYNNMSWGGESLKRLDYFDLTDSGGIYENNTSICDKTVDFDNGAFSAIQNNFILGGCIDVDPGVTYEKNGSGNAFSNAGYQNLTAADEFVSTTASDGNTFLMPSKDGNLYFQGNAPTITGHDRSINNVAVEEDAISIGAKEQLVLGVSQSNRLYKLNSHRMKYLWNRKNLIR